MMAVIVFNCRRKTHHHRPLHALDGKYSVAVAGVLRALLKTRSGNCWWVGFQNHPLRVGFFSIFISNNLMENTSSCGGGRWRWWVVCNTKKMKSKATMNAAETNGPTTSSFVQHLRIVSGFLIMYAVTSFAGSLWGGAFAIQEEEEAPVNDLEAGPQEAKETNVQTIFKFLQDNFNRAVGSSIGKKALVIMPTFPATFCFALPGLLCLAQIKWQLAPLGFPSSTLHKWYTVCVTSLLTEFVASIAQWIISAAGP